MRVAFEGTGDLVLSFEADESLTPGALVVLSDNDKVVAAGEGVRPAGLCLQLRCGIAAVQVKGFVELPYSGTVPTVGWNSLLCDGTGGLKTAADGSSCLVVHVDTATQTIGLYL